MEDQKGVGRPEIGPKFQVTLPDSVAEEVDELARANGLSRSEQLRLLVMSGLESTGMQDDEGRPAGLKPRLLHRGALILLEALGTTHPAGYIQVTKALGLLADPDAVTNDQMWSAAQRMTVAVKSISGGNLSQSDQATLRRAIGHAAYVLTRPWMRAEED